MRFFDRKDEMALLRRIREESKSSARMTILKGRRRIGYTRIGNWWNRKGESEIDIVAVDDISRRIDFFEVKHDASRFNKGDLQRKADEFLTVSAEFADFKKGFKGVSVEDM